MTISMKKLVSLFVLAALATACAEKPGYQITGTVSNADLNGKYVYLYGYGKDAAVVDSALVENGAFKFEGEQTTPTLNVIRFADDVVEPKGTAAGDNGAFMATFILQNGKIAVTLDETPVVKGTAENDALNALQTDLRSLRADMKKFIDAMNSEDKAAAKEAEAQYEKIDASISAAVKKFIEDHPNWQTSGKLLSDFRYSLDEDTRRTLVAAAGDSLKAVPGVDKIISHLAVLEKVAIGKKFTDFEMADTKGKMHKLSEYVGNGKVVLIDFWASWCPPCRRDMPHLVELYKQYKGKKFQIVGISLDRTVDAWEKGIKELGITWPQLSDVKYWENAGAALYGVNSIPHTVLVDKDGTIVAKNLHGEALDAKVAELVK